MLATLHLSLALLQEYIHVVFALVLCLTPKILSGLHQSHTTTSFVVDFHQSHRWLQGFVAFELRKQGFLALASVIQVVVCKVLLALHQSHR